MLDAAFSYSPSSSLAVRRNLLKARFGHNALQSQHVSKCYKFIMMANLDEHLDTARISVN